MGKKLYPTDTAKQAQSILSAWDLIDPTLKIGSLTKAILLANVSTVAELQRKVVELQKALDTVRTDRDLATIELWNNIKRARSGVKGIYGDDSSQYELIGGTRRSERKKPRRRSLPVSSEYDNINSQ